jgi:hypothetical protein
MTSLYMKLKSDQLLRYDILYSPLYLHFLFSFVETVNSFCLVNFYYHFYYFFSLVKKCLY